MFTVTTKDHHALVASHLLKLRGGFADHQVTAQDSTGPAPTVTAGGNHLAEVRAFLIKYYGTEQDPQLGLPLHTVTTKDRFGLVTVHGDDYVIADIGMRMLVPRELFRAQGFPDTYRIELEVDGKPLSKGARSGCAGTASARRSPRRRHAGSDRNQATKVLRQAQERSARKEEGLTLIST
jgi:DNA (cytosine-5)-methyltransferase 1